MGTSERILFVEDVATDAELAAAAMRQAGLAFESRRVETAEEFLAALADFDPTVIVSDYALPKFDGMAALALALERVPDVPFLVLTGSTNEETAVACMLAGAWDYVLKDRLTRLPLAVRAALDRARLLATEREAERALRRSEEQQRAFFLASADGVFVKDAQLRTVLANPAYAALMGIPLDRILGRDDTGFMPAVLARGCRASDLRALAGDRPVLSEEEAFDRVFETRKFPVPLADGSVGVGGYVRDVTEQRRAAEALRESEARYRGVFANSSIGIYITTPAGEVVDANPALLAMLGYESLEELRTRNLESEGFEPQSPREEFKAAIERTGFVRGFEARWRRKDGSVLVVRESAQAIRAADGSVLHYEGVIEDVTERARAQESLRRLAAAVDQAVEMVVVTDREGTIEYVNPAFERITGYPSDEVIGHSPSILNSGAHDREFYRELWDTITGGRPWAGHFLNRRKDGTVYEEEATISPVRNERGEIRHFVAVKRDVTREVALQQQLNQAQKMEAVGRLAGGIAHDFNNLLQALNGQLAVLRLRLRHAPEAERPVADAEQLVRRGAALTRQLLLFARREGATREPLDLNAVVEDAATLLRRVVRENVGIVVELGRGSCPVLADRTQVEQVLMNLVVNASDAMPEGGRLTLRTGSDAASVWLAVSDTGQGIADEILAHLFEPFFTTKGAGKGTGLGLSVVHGIVVAHGGRVVVASTPGNGATFTVVLPRQEPTTPGTAMPAATESPAGRGERVLLVEDEAGARKALVEVLGALGYSITAAADAEQARALPALPRHDLLLTDFLLPGASGAELAIELRCRWPRLRVVVMSGYPEDGIFERLGPGGVAAFLQKPFAMDELARTLRRVLDEEGPGDVGR